MNHSPIEIYLNSANANFKVNGTKNSDVIFYFSDPIQKPLTHSFALRVVACSIPLSMYIVNTSNNKLVINSVSYTIPVGNYNSIDLGTKINSLIVATGISASFDSSTNKYTFSIISGNFTINSTSTCLGLIGFVSGSSYTSVGSVLTSNSVCNLSGSNNILYVDLPNITTYNLSSATGKRTSIIKSIPCSANNGELLFWENNTSSVVYLDCDLINFFNIRIIGEDILTPVDFNSINWNITLEVSFIPKENQSEMTAKGFKESYEHYVKKIEDERNQIKENNNKDKINEKK